MNIKYLCILLLSLYFVSCSKKIQYLGSYPDTKAVSGPHLVFLSLKDPKMASLSLKSSLFKIGKDSLVITMVDKNRDSIYNQEEDLLAITAPGSIYIPILKYFNPNVTSYEEDLLIAHQDNLLQVEKVTDDGNDIKLKYIGKTQHSKIKPKAILNDKIDLTNTVQEVYSNTQTTIANLLADQMENNKFTYFHFWYTSCIPCIEEIPNLRKIQQKGIAVINIALEKFDDPERLKKMIAKFDYPGLHYYGNEALVRNLAQNGFPYGVLVVTASGKKIRSEGNVMEVFAELRDK